MNVQIILDQPPGGLFTNLDVVSGRVVLRLPKASNISSIQVKLEGEANSTLSEEDNTADRNTRSDTEKHRILYKIQKVFPPRGAAEAKAFAVQAGIYEYPFQFKLPFNNQCELNTQHVGVFGYLDGRAHAKSTLPPSFQQSYEAGVFYYVKCTVALPSFFRENPRVATFFNFSPIEPPRPPPDGECYARRQHAFTEDMDRKRKKSGGIGEMFRKNSNQNPASPVSPPVRFTIDARLANPAILTCGAKVPLRILITQQTPRTMSLFLQTLQVEIIGHTLIRAGSIKQTKGTSWVICSVSNLHHEIGKIDDPAGTTVEIPNSFWEGYRLPDSICPGFTTCNITRTYELVATVGLSYGTTQPGLDQFISLPLRHRIDIFSGIAPPPELLQRMAERKPTAPIITGTGAAAPPIYSEPVGSVIPVQAGPSAASADMNEPPPSYEDAMADNAPVMNAQGPRDGYRPPPPQADVWADEKRR